MTLQKVLIVIGLTVIMAGGFWLLSQIEAPEEPDVSPPLVFGKKIDDWQYKPGQDEEGGILQRVLGPSSGAPGAIPKMQPMAESADSIGLAVGGAKDISNFRENIENDYLPLSTDITYEGLFYDYYFDTGQGQECEKLFCPSYSYALSKDPFSQEKEYYLSVGLNSNIKETDFQRKKLNLVIVLDISGSMSSPFRQYYYDRFGRKIQIDEEQKDQDSQKSKIELAAQSITALLDHLKPEDRLGIALFDNQAYLAKPLNFVGETKMQKIKDHILEIQARGGTRMSAGMQMATGLYNKEILNSNQSEYENRIIFLTDAMPNLGETSEQGLLGMTKKNAANKLYTTFIGIGVDFNTELVETITKIRGANYYSVHSAKEFKQRMDEEFEYMVTPLVFNLVLNLEAQGYEIEKVYGSPEANEATGEIMKVNTLFPSKREAEQTKGGLVLLKLKKQSDQPQLILKVSYEDRSGKTDTSQSAVELEEKESDYFANTGIRKGILLARYANLMKHWLNDTRKDYQVQEPVLPAITREKGIIVPEPIEPVLGRWERQSIPLQVSEDYKELFTKFTSYFEKEMQALNDNTLNQELTILEKLKQF